MTKDTTESAPSMFQRINDCKTSGDLFKLATSQEFRDVFATLSEEERLAMRNHYDATKDLLQHRIKFEEIEGETVTVKDARVMPSEYGECVVLKGTRVGGGGEPKPFETITSATRVLRHFTEHWKDLPAEYVFTKGEHPSDPKKTMWDVRRVTKSSAPRMPWE